MDASLGSSTSQQIAISMFKPTGGARPGPNKTLPLDRSTIWPTPVSRKRRRRISEIGENPVAAILPALAECCPLVLDLPAISRIESVPSSGRVPERSH
jgi:hypothetical protein